MSPLCSPSTVASGGASQPSPTSPLVAGVFSRCSRHAASLVARLVEGCEHWSRSPAGRSRSTPHAAPAANESAHRRRSHLDGESGKTYRPGHEGRPRPTALLPPAMGNQERRRTRTRPRLSTHSDFRFTGKSGPGGMSPESQTEPKVVAFKLQIGVDHDLTEEPYGSLLSREETTHPDGPKVSRLLIRC